MNKYSLLLLVFITGCGLLDKPVPPKPEPPKKVETPIRREPEPQPIKVEPDGTVLAEKKRKEKLLKQLQEEATARIKQQEDLAAQRILEEAKKIEQERINKETLETRYKAFVTSRDSLIVTFESLLPKVKYQITKFEEQIEEASRQITGRKNKIRELERQINAQRDLLAAVPKDHGKISCPNMLCGKYTGTDTMTSTCPYCGTTLRKNDNIANKKAEINNRIAQLNKSIQFEQQMLNNISTEEAQAGLERLKNTQVIITQALVSLKYSTSRTDGDNMKAIAILEQTLKTQKEILESIGNVIPAFKETPKPMVKVEPTTPKKVYTLNNGQTIEVKTEMVAGNEIIIKTMDGKMVTINKKDIAQ